MSDNNITTSTSGQEELEKPIPPAVHNNSHGHGHGHGHSHGHGHGHSHVVQQSHQLIDKLAAETKPLALPLPLPLPLPVEASTDSSELSPTSSSSSSSSNLGLEVGLKVEGPKNDSENDLGQSGIGNRTNTATAESSRHDHATVTNNGQSMSSNLSAAAGTATANSGEVIRKIELEILPSIGESFQLQQVNYNESVVNLKKIIINKLKLQNREQITLLYREKVLLMGLITDYGICHGSRITLLPSIETGLLAQRPEQSVLEALEGLNETQINDFLSGKSPLNLTMRLGEHVMLIQLQLSKGQALAAAAAAAASHSHRQSQHSVSTASTSSSGKTPLISSSSIPTGTSSFTNKSDDSNTSNSPTLAEASRNLTKTLKRISSKVNKVTSTGTTLSTHSSKHHRSSPSTSSSARARESKGDDDEIINLKHHGKGVYSGTFSGTLNPALQDSLGKPRKHVSTIVHILNDLLGTIDLRSGVGEHSITEVGLKSSSIGTTNSLKRKKTSSGRRTSNGSSSTTPGQLLVDALASELADSEELHDSVLTKPVVALKLQKMSNKDGDDDISKKDTSEAVVISKDEENRLLRLKIEKLKENLLARKLKRNS